MSTFSIIVIVVLAYLVQVLLLLAYPYHRYRKDYRSHQQRTIGGFVDFTHHIMGNGYMFIVFFPIFGILLFVVALLIGLIIEGTRFIYTKFIKDIKI